MIMSSAVIAAPVDLNAPGRYLHWGAKDGLNSVGIGSRFNVLDFGQMLMWHIVLLPLLVGGVVVVHVLQVRRRGVVPPFGINPMDLPHAQVSA